MQRAANDNEMLNSDGVRISNISDRILLRLQDSARNRLESWERRTSMRAESLGLTEAELDEQMKIVDEILAELRAEEDF